MAKKEYDGWAIADGSNDAQVVFNCETEEQAWHALYLMMMTNTFEAWKDALKIKGLRAVKVRIAEVEK